MGTVEKYVTPGGKGGYLARFSFVDGAGVRRHRKRRCRTKKEAEAWTAQQEADQSRGVRFEPSREPFGEVVQRWLRLVDTPKRSPRTIGLYRAVARLRLASLAQVPVCDVTTARLRALVSEWERAKLKPETQAMGMKVLAGAIDLLIDEGALLVTPLRGVSIERRVRPELRTWTPAQVRTFLDTQEGQPYGYAWTLLFTAMLRIGELAALRWEDIDAAGVVMVRRTWSQDRENHWYIADAPKTPGAVRSIPLGPKVLRLLQVERSARVFDDAGWVCADGRGVFNPIRLRSRWTAAVKASGLKPLLTPHGARHSGATSLIAAGMPVSAVQKLLGHTDGSFTLRRYVHPGSIEMGMAVEAITALYASPGIQSAPEPLAFPEKSQRIGDKSS